MSRIDSKKVLPLPEVFIKHHEQVLIPLQEDWIKHKRVSPVQLITGAEGVGKRAVVYHLAQWFLCEKAGWKSENVTSTRPCQECPSCKRALSGNWLDFTEISGETEEGESGALKIEHFEKLKSSQGFGGFNSTYRITLIRDADRLTTAAANSLLKLLEEPPKGWVIFLTASSRSQVLPTLMSRCRSIALRPLNESVIFELLRLSEIPKERHAFCSENANGSWGRALKLGTDDTWSIKEKLSALIEKASTEDLHELVDYAAAKPSQFETVLDLFGLSLVKKAVNDARIASLIERAEEVRIQSRAPLNRKLLMQDLLLPLLKRRPL